MFRPADSFWLPRIEALARTGLPHQYRMMVETGRVGNLEIAAGEPGVFVRGFIFDDSDIYKWLEACAYVLATVPDEALRQLAQKTISTIAKAQRPDGYLNSYIQILKPEEAWAGLSHSHELYCAGHLIEAGVAWKEALGGSELLDVALKFAALIERRYGPDGASGIDGHPEIELALLRLADTTGDPRPRALSARMLSLRGVRPSPFETELRKAAGDAPLDGQFFRDGLYDGDYAQDHAPISEQREIRGHAVRAAYLYAGAARLLQTQPDDARLAALEALWANLTERRMYVTGGIGSSARNEGFTSDYDLPNRSAYAETCASCALVFWGDEMLRLTGDSAYADIVELALFNGVLAGISPEGDRYFYANPLESRDEHARAPWFPCACCPANAARTIARVTDWAIHADEGRASLHFPVSGIYPLGDLTLTVKADYPNSGIWTLTVAARRRTRFELAIRIPGWASEVEMDTPDALGEADYRKGYAVFDRDWEGETTLSIDWPMPATWLAAHPLLLDDAGRLALQRGPTIYAAIRGDAPVAPQHLRVDHEAEIEVQGHALKVEALYEPLDPPDSLYPPYESKELQETIATYVPYRDWADAGPTEMAVWVNRL